MAELTSIAELDLSPIPGKTYLTLQREWREEFIYFLLVDRFHDSDARSPTLGAGRTPGVPTPNDFYGGTIRGVLNNLDYIAGLGCTSIWLSPIFETNAYHGYDISNYLKIEPRFGTKQDLVDLVNAAHAFQKNGRPFPIRIILDVVINHSGDNWSYPGGSRYNYAGDQQFPLGAWRKGDRPIPTELREEKLYHRRGEIQNWDSFPEAYNGDVSTLKDFVNDDTKEGSELINIMIQAHAYWIREADVDGFRVDAVKHMGELASSRFCSGIREYAYSLGKRGFFLFGELATPSDEIYDRYIGPNTSQQDGNNTVFFGIDSLLDFRLAAGDHPLRGVLKGFDGPEPLYNRLEAQRKRALNRGEIGRYLVTFVDNHDAFWQGGRRFAAGAPDDQVIGSIAFLLCSLGTPCLYYGTEQGFAGVGEDVDMREGMFDKNTPGKNLLNPDCKIYQEIAKLADVVQKVPALRFGRMYYRQISGNGVDFGMPFGSDYTLALSRILYGREVLFAYNVSSAARNDCIVIDASYHALGSSMRFLYGGGGSATALVQTAPNGTRFVQLPLGGHQVAILE